MVAKRQTKKEPKDEQIMIRFKKSDRDRIEAIATQAKLDLSAWVRQAVLLAVDAAERGQSD